MYVLPYIYATRLPLLILSCCNETPRLNKAYGREGVFWLIVSEVESIEVEVSLHQEAKAQSRKVVSSTLAQ